MPRWYKGVPRCPDLLLPKDEDIPDPESKPAGHSGAEGESETQTVTNPGAPAEDSPAAQDLSNASSREEKKLLALTQTVQS